MVYKPTYNWAHPVGDYHRILASNSDMAMGQNLLLPYLDE